MLRAAIVALTVLVAPVAYGWEMVPLKTVLERFGAEAVAEFAAADTIVALNVDVLGWSYASSSFKERYEDHPWNWSNDFRPVGEIVQLGPGLVESARSLLVDETAYWDVPPDDTLMCLTRVERLLLVSGESSSYVCMFEGNCAKLSVYSEEGRPIGFGQLSDEASAEWLTLFEEALGANGAP